MHKDNNDATKRTMTVSKTANRAKTANGVMIPTSYGIALGC